MEAEQVGEDRGRDVREQGDEGPVAGGPGVDAVVEEFAAEAGGASGSAGEQSRDEPPWSGTLALDPGLSAGGLDELVPDCAARGRPVMPCATSVGFRLLRPLDALTP